MAIPPPPVIEGTLKNTIHAIAFGLITTVLVVNFGRILVPNFFVWIMVVVVIIETVLLLLTKKREDYEVYQPQGRKGKHTIEGSGGPQITVDAPENDVYESPKKKQGIRQRLRDKTGKKEGKAGLEVGSDDVFVEEGRRSPTKLPSPQVNAKKLEKAEKKHEKAEDKAKEKAETKKLDKAEEKARPEKAKGKEEAEGKGKETDEEGGKEKTKGKSWKSRLHRKSQGESE